VYQPLSVRGYFEFDDFIFPMFPAPWRLYTHVQMAIVCVQGFDDALLSGGRARALTSILAIVPTPDLIRLNFVVRAVPKVVPTTEYDGG